MNNMIWLMRATKWARKPPSAKMVKLVFAIIAAGLAMLLLEKLGMWPEWATLDQRRGMRIPR
ncbi:hypothetical protein [Paracoccus sp. R86501]|uniref:hypothetical protein n=1 Tax=Paracoccus sp. R86501 TaxID=3101711 RepID=UPI00366D45A6